MESDRLTGAGQSLLLLITVCSLSRFGPPKAEFVLMFDVRCQSASASVEVSISRMNHSSSY